MGRRHQSAAPDGNDGLIWPHLDGFIWPHLRPIATGGSVFAEHEMEVAERMGSRVELYERIQRDRDLEGLSIHALARRHGVHTSPARTCSGTTERLSWSVDSPPAPLILGS